MLRKTSSEFLPVLRPEIFRDGLNKGIIYITIYLTAEIIKLVI